MMYPHADAGSLANYFLASQQLLKDLQPIPVTERLPDLATKRWNGRCSWPVLAYDRGWSMAVYIVETSGAAYWQYAAEGVSGYEYEVERLENVTHWMELPPAPED